MNTFTKLPEFPFFVVHRAERWCVYTVTQNMQREDKVNLRWFENSRYSVVDYYTKINVLGYLNSGMWLLCNKDGNIIENYTEEKDVTTVQKKLKPSDVKGYVRDKHHPYTDYNQEIADWLVVNANVEYDAYFCAFNKFIFTGADTFYTHNHAYSYEVYYTNDEYKKLIGMDDALSSTKQTLDELYKTNPTVVRQYLKELATREDNIRKELEFAEAKKARLEKHIDTLKSKLQ